MPAAGRPAPMPTARPVGQIPPPGPQVLPEEAKETVTALGARAPSGSAVGNGPKPAARPPGPPRPAAGAPPGGLEEPHPADGDGPTIQAAPLSEEVFTTRGLSEPPTLMEPASRDRPLSHGGAAHSPMDVIEPEALEYDDEDEDQAQTMVGIAREPAGGAASFPRIAGASPGAHGSAAGGAREAGPFNATFPLASPLMPAPYGSSPAMTGEVPFPESMAGPGNSTLGMPQPAVQHHDPNDYGARAVHSVHPGEAYGHFGPQGPEFLAQSGYPSMQRIPRMPLGRDNRTMTAQRFKRRPPMWVVAAISCCIALAIAGVVVVVLWTTSAALPRATQQSGGGAPSPERGSPGGPFGAARTAFNTAVNVPAPAPPPTMEQPPPAPPPAHDTELDGESAAEAPEAAATTTAAPAPEPTPAPAPPQPTARATAATPRANAPTPVPVPAVPKKVAAPSGPGALTVVCIPKCDQIIDNGTSLGPGHIFNKAVPSGRHALVLSANGVKKNLTVEVLPDQTKEVRISMDR